MPRWSVEILDVREPEEWQAGRIEGSRHVQMQTIPERLDELPRDRMVAAVGAAAAGAAD